jgi:hypothetical protein
MNGDVKQARIELPVQDHIRPSLQRHGTILDLPLLLVVICNTDPTAVVVELVLAGRFRGEPIQQVLPLLDALMIRHHLQQPAQKPQPCNVCDGNASN